MATPTIVYMIMDGIQWNLSSSDQSDSLPRYHYYIMCCTRRPI